MKREKRRRSCGDKCGIRRMKKVKMRSYVDECGEMN